MSTNFMGRMPEWHNLVWIGSVGSVVAWVLAWFSIGWTAAVMLLVALASVALAYRAVRGMRLAFVGLMVAGLAMFLGSLYFAAILGLFGGAASIVHWVTIAVFPMVTSIALLLGAVPGFRRARTTAQAA
jgi:hypothetical protein